MRFEELVGAAAVVVVVVVVVLVVFVGTIVGVVVHIVVGCCWAAGCLLRAIECLLDALSVTDLALSRGHERRQLLEVVDVHHHTARTSGEESM